MSKRTKHKKKADYQKLGLLDFGSVFLRTVKLLTDFFYIIVILFGMLGVGLAFGYLASQIDAVKVPDKESLVSQVTSLTRVSQMSYSDGSSIAAIDTDLLRTPVASDAISENIKHAIVATEDENFEGHDGVVPKAVFRATLGSVLGLGETSGGSTLTQQLIKQQILGDDPTFKRKSREIIYALALERYLSKDEILTDYLNVSPFGRNNKGENIAGIEEAAQGIFGVSANDLTIPQAAFLAGLPQSPIVYSPYTAAGKLKDADNMSYGLSRQQDVLYNMYRAGYLTKDEYNEYKSYDISQDFIQPASASTSYHDFLYYSVLEEAQDIMYDYLIEKNGVSEQELKNDATKEAYRKLASDTLQQGGYTVKTTIDKNVYNAMQNAVSQYGSTLDQGSSQTVDVGNVLMDNSTGAILGFIGGRDYSTNQNNHAFDTARSPGSSIKPIIAYGIAIDQGLLGSASMLSNYPTNFSSGQPIMHGNDVGTGMINLQEALNVSWNIPAYWTYQMLLNNNVDVESYMKKMGYSIDNYNIESLPLGGGIETTVLQQVNAYQMISNGGVYLKGYLVDSITDNQGNVIYKHKANPVRVFSEATASILNQLLKEVVTGGATTEFYKDLQAINGSAAQADWSGKTGTTDNYTDVWLMLSTPKVTLGGWAGNDDNTSLDSMAGYRYNAQYMANLVNSIYNANSNTFGTGKYNLSSNVMKSTVLKATGLQPGTVTVNGRSLNVSGETTTSYWAKTGAGNMTYKFAIGGTDSDYTKAWDALLHNSSIKTNNSN
ncbi:MULTISPECIES: penicillin-binding protein PBP1B [Streptococcus]|uniref:Penicillin-binding protein n=2 Tax=Streptococcus TaxID=1301 RepID=A0A239RDF4_STREI|nr:MULTISPECIES: penicillin-binding protein PBP1B [Streptococcus]EQC70970.1 Multimodular transpeptidase-transglycosylase [Streptococcus sp. HSISB1]MDO4885754.1 penicillin-binding protein PBP1B [Streptococcus sp.]SEK61109.1 penicillin-binding protein [Streptococcus equinus]SNU08520.1 penicillin-binding protein [Streptococcus equinus]